LWPMSRSNMPKQLLPLVNGRSLLDLAYRRLEGLVESTRRFVCAGEVHRDVILRSLPGLVPGNYLGEPTGRDTLNAIAYATAVIARMDPDATIGVFAADALIEPDDRFRQTISRGYEIADAVSGVIVTFGIPPADASTAFGYLQLGERHSRDAWIVTRFKEKPEKPIAEQWVAEGPEKYLWNSGMFVFRAATLLDCIRRYEPEAHAGALRIAGDWGGAGFDETIHAVYPNLKKISIDYAIMEKAVRDASVRMVAVPMDVSWTDIGSWSAFADTCTADDAHNTRATDRCVFVDTSGTFVASNDPAHLVAVIGCQDLIVVHTADATLVCRRDRAEELKKLHAMVSDRFGAPYV
jgi:mannose-1-phosphate guanylyltransferase